MSGPSHLASTLLATVAVVAAVLVWPRSPPDRLARVGRRSSEVQVPPRARAGPRRRRSGSAPPVAAVGAGLAPGVLVELVAAALRAGSPPALALEAAARSAGGGVQDALGPVVTALRLGVDPQSAWSGCPPQYAVLARAFLLAERSGAPVAGVLARVAVDERSARRRRAQVAARRLGVRLVLPLGLAVLPGFVLLAVVPVVLALATTLLGSG